VAVIKQKRTTFASNIGVVRADTGAADVWRGVGKIADNLIQGSFNQLKQEALTKGADAAQTASLRSINPETGKPELVSSISAPEGFGSIAQNAYNQVIEKRYINAIEQDFKIKAAELALKYKYNQDSVSLFENEFADFIEQTTKNTVSKFQGTAKQIGSGLLASNKLNLMEQDLVRNRTILSDDFNLSHKNNLSDLEAMHSSPDINMQEDALELELNSLKNLENFFLAFPDQMNAAEKTKYQTEIFQARTAGALNRIGNFVLNDKDLDSQTLNDVRLVLSNNGIGLEALPEGIKGIVSSLVNAKVLTNFSGSEDVRPVSVFQDVKKFADTTLASIQNKLVSRENAKIASENKDDRDQTKKDLVFQSESLFGLTEARQTADRNISDKILNSDIDGAIAEFESYSKKTTALSDPSLGRAAINVTTAQSSIKNLRQSLLTSLLDVATSGLTARQSEDLTAYIDTGGKYGDVLDSVKPLADKIIDTMDIGVDRKELARYGSAINVDKARVEKANAATNSTIKAQNQIKNGQGSSTNAKQTEVVDDAIINTIGQGNEQFFLTSEAVESRDVWGRSIINANVLPDSLQSYIKNLYAGMPMPPEAQQNLMVLYDKFSRVLKEDGSKAAVNMWANSTLTNKENAFFQTVLAVTKFQGYDNLPLVMGEIRAQYDNKDSLAIKMTAMFPDGLNDFLVKQTTDDKFFGTDTVNPNIAKDLLPYVEYLVAGNASKDTIETLTTAFFKDLYPETEGVVQDFEFGNVNRSRQALSAIFPSKDDRIEVVSFLNKLISDKYGMPNKRFHLTKYDSEIVEGQGLVDIPPQDRLVLMPLQGSGTPIDSMRYMVVERRSNGIMVPFIAPVRGSSPQEVNVPQQVIVDVAQLKSAVDVDLPEPIDPKLLAKLATQRATGFTAKRIPEVKDVMRENLINRF